MRKAFDLRPLDFNDVIGRSFSLYTANFVAYLRWFLLMWLLPMMVVAVVFYFALDPYDWSGSLTRPEPSLFEPNRYALYHWILQLSALLFGFTTGASGIYYMTARVYVGGNPTLTEVMRAVYQRFGHVAGTGFLHVCVLIAISVACIMPPILLVGANSKGAGVLLGMVLWCAYVPLILWYYAAYGLNTSTVMLDEAETTESFGRSAYLSKGFRMRVAGILFVTILVVGAPGVPGLLSIPAIVAETMLVNDAGSPLLGVMVGLLSNALLLPLFFIPFVVYYFDMRCRKESYDLAVMARNFGIAEGEMQRFRFNPHLGYVPKGWKGERTRKRKGVRKPNQRPAAVRHAAAGMQMAQPWGPQPGMPGGFPGGAQQWGPPPAPPQPQWAPPPGQWQNPQWGPPQSPQNPQYQPNPNPPPLPGVRRPISPPNPHDPRRQ
ncbi:MAG: hypothetical protein KDB29_03310 [Planctomycetes bacterium]|nr:hypothetical protein [Planctomycetota bacterium]